jgi:hypothetical protein
VENAREKIDLIVQYLERNGHMSENYFEQILGGDDADTIDHFIERIPMTFWFLALMEKRSCTHGEPEKAGSAGRKK